MAAAVLTSQSSRPIPPHRINPYRGLWSRQKPEDHDLDDILGIKE